MVTHIALAALLVAAGTSFAAAQASPPAAPRPMPAPPMKSAPTAGQTNQTNQTTSGTYRAPPAAREGEKGLPTGEGATSGDPVQMKRKP